MKMKITIICFILLLFLIVGVTSAANNDNNETLQMKESMNDELVKVAIKDTNTYVSKSVEIDGKMDSTPKNVSKSFFNSLSPVKKLNVKISAPNVKMYYKDGSKFKITLKNSLNQVLAFKAVKIQINKQNYLRFTDAKGTATLNLNLKSGTYKVFTLFNGNSFYYQKNVTSTITVQSTIKCGDFSKYYKNELAYSSIFYDSKGKVLKNTKINFKLNSKTYTVKTDIKGVAKLAINLKPGKYNISVINAKTSESISKTVTIKNLIITKDVTMTSKDGSKYTVKLLKSNGKVAPYTKFKLNLNGKVIYEKTDKNGICNVKLNLNAGKYSVSVQYQGITNINKIIVNAILNQINNIKNALTVKKSVQLFNVKSENKIIDVNHYIINNGFILKNQGTTTMMS